MEESFSWEDDVRDWGDVPDDDVEELMQPGGKSPGTRALHSTEKVHEAVTGLSRRQLNRLKAAGYQYVRQYGLDPVVRTPGDLVNEAMIRTLDGRRGWRQDVELMAHLIMVMSSIASSWRKHDVRRADAAAAEHRETDLKPAGDGDTGGRVENAPARDADEVTRQVAQADLDAIRQHFVDAGDEMVTDLLELWQQGSTGPEIRRQQGISDKDYWAACRRLRRWVRKEARDG